MRERKSTAIKKQRALSELMMACDNATIACENAGIVRSTFYKWQEDDQQFAANVEIIIRRINTCAQDRVVIAAIQDNPKLWKQRLDEAQRKLGLIQKKHLQNACKNKK
jgi:hypothetical protein